MQNITIELRTKNLDEKALQALLERVLRELEKEGLKKAVTKATVHIQ